MTTFPPVTAAPNASGPRSKILVAVALDATGDEALLEGMRLAASVPGSELHVVHALTSRQAAPAWQDAGCRLL